MDVDYWEEGWEDEVPYEVELDGGRVVLVHLDDESVIRAEPPPERLGWGEWARRWCAWLRGTDVPWWKKNGLFAYYGTGHLYARPYQYEGGVDKRRVVAVATKWRGDGEITWQGKLPVCIWGRGRRAGRRAGRQASVTCNFIF